MNHQKAPKFLSQHDHFTADKVLIDSKTCNLWCMCKFEFSQVTKTQGLHDIISSNFFVLLDTMNHWGHVSINLNAPLTKIK